MVPAPGHQTLNSNRAGPDHGPPKEGPMVLLCFVGKPQIPPTDRDVFTTLLLSFDPGITILPEFPLYPILGNPRFSPGVQDVVFRGLSGAGLYQASHFSTGGRWKTISELTYPLGLFRLDFLRARQLSHFLKSRQPLQTVACYLQHLRTTVPQREYWDTRSP